VAPAPSPLKLQGTAEILGLAGCFFPSSFSPAGVAVFLPVAGPRGTMLGDGLVASPREGLWLGPVVVMVATFVAARSIGCHY
jgi:hypothetical protein